MKSTFIPLAVLSLFISGASISAYVAPDEVFTELKASQVEENNDDEPEQAFPPADEEEPEDQVFLPAADEEDTDPQTQSGDTFLQVENDEPEQAFPPADEEEPEDQVSLPAADEEDTEPQTQSGDTSPPVEEEQVFLPAADEEEPEDQVSLPATAPPKRSFYRLGEKIEPKDIEENQSGNTFPQVEEEQVFLPAADEEEPEEQVFLPADEEDTDPQSQSGNTFPQVENDEPELPLAADEEVAPAAPTSRPNSFGSIITYGIGMLIVMGVVFVALFALRMKKMRTLAAQTQQVPPPAPSTANIAPQESELQKVLEQPPESLSIEKPPSE